MPANKLVLSANPRLRALLLCLLYFCQGFPWGFSTIALVATLSAAGFSKADTATVTALSILPWAFKFFWAPLIDSLRFPSLGLRRPWIIFAQSGMALTLLLPVGMGAVDNVSALHFIAWVFFAHNCFASLQDVSADALAVDLLTPTERGRILSFMWASKLLGIAVGGAGMALVTARAGLATAMLTQVAMTVSVMLLVIVLRERPTNRLFPWHPLQADILEIKRPFGIVITARELLRALTNRTTFTLVFVAMAYTLCEGLYDPLVAEFFIQELGWSAERFATSQGTFGVTGELAGALLGGYLADKFGGRLMARIGILILMSVMIGFALLAPAWQQPPVPLVLLLPAAKGMIAFVTVSMFVVFMKVSWTTAAATQFTLYMASSNIGYSLGAKLNAWLPAMGFELSIADFFTTAGIITLPAFFLLFGLDTNAVAARREAEEAALAEADTAAS
ncbi:MAG: MFS transporter [Gammaproteobacteria bacterium]|nr:MFS transporter [Gammaproteobacteria bacterium]